MLVILANGSADERVNGESKNESVTHCPNRTLAGLSFERGSGDRSRR